MGSTTYNYRKGGDTVNYTIEIANGVFTVRHCSESRGFGPVIGTGRTLQQAFTIINLHYAPIADLESMAALPDSRECV